MPVVAHRMCGLRKADDAALTFTFTFTFTFTPIIVVVEAESVSEMHVFAQGDVILSARLKELALVDHQPVGTVMIALMLVPELVCIVPSLLRGLVIVIGVRVVGPESRLPALQHSRHAHALP